MVRLSRIGAGLRPQLVAKLEVFNPGGSIKDRVAVRLIEAAERDGRLRAGGTIIEPTSGNTGTGLAIAARLKGYRVIAVMPDKMSREKIDLLRAYGAEVVIAPTDVPPESPQSYYRVADRLTEEIPGAFQPNQYRNPANPQTHYETTGPELWRQTGGRVTHLVIGVGTGGTITGVARYIRERQPGVVVIGADPVGSIFSGDEVHPYLVEGVGEDFWPETYDPSVVDRYVRVSDRDSFLTTRRLAEQEGMLVGGSCGLAVHAALRGRRGDRRSRGDGRRDPARRRARLPVEDLQRRLDGVARHARAPVRPHGGRRAARQARAPGEIPPLVVVETRQRVRDAIALLHEHRVSQLPVVSQSDRTAVVGSIGERGLLKHARGRPRDHGHGDRRRDGAAVPRRGGDRPGARGGGAALRRPPGAAGHGGGRPAGIVTRADLLEALVS